VVRLAAIAALLTMAAAVAWSRTPGCDPPDATRAGVVTAGSFPSRSAGPGAPDRAGGAGPSGGAADGAADGAAGALDATVPAARWAGDDRNGGDPITARAAPPSGTLGVPVRLAEPTALALLRPGDRVDLLSVGGSGGTTTPVAEGATVLAVSGIGDPTAGGLLLALRPAEARRTIGADPRTRFAVLIRPDG
jgi:hypothetical protein